MEKSCQVCGKKYFTTSPKSMYCSRKCQSAKEAERRAEERARRKERKSEQSLVAIAVEAKKLGMTYGQYVAQMEFERQKGAKNEQSKKTGTERKKSWTK